MLRLRENGALPVVNRAAISFEQEPPIGEMEKRRASRLAFPMAPR